MHKHTSPIIYNGRDYTTQFCLGQSTLKMLILLLMTLFGLAACTSSIPGGTPPTVKIGLVVPFEGLHRPLGYELLFAVKLALQERNQNQGLNGYRVELVALNDFDDPQEAQWQAQALAADPDVLGVIGHLSSEATLAARPVYQAANLAVVTPWTVDFSRLEDSQNSLISVAADQAKTAAQLTAAAQAAGFNQIVELTGANLDQLADNPQALELATDGVTAGQIILALQEAGISLPLFGQADVGSPQLIQVAKEAANGLTFVSPGPEPADVGAEAFSNAYRALAGFPPGPRAVLAYDATQVLLDSIEQFIDQHNRPPTRSEVKQTLTTVQRTGLSGSISFDPQGKRIKAPVWLYQISRKEYPGTLLIEP